MQSLDDLKSKAAEIQNLSKELVEAANNTFVESNNNIVVGVDPFIFGITVFVLSCFIGYYVIWKVTPALHTPLMSVTNAISAIILIGAMIAVGTSGSTISHIFGFIAVFIASINLFGGFVVTQRMLQMFRKKTNV
jgi:NAD(P) transhydrogenase subunit alpha